MTIRTGLRSSRRRHSSPSTAVGRQRLLLRRGERPEVDDDAAGGRGRGSRRASSPTGRRPRRRSARAPRLRARSASCCAPGRGEAAIASTDGGRPSASSVGRARRAPRGRRSGRGAAAPPGRRARSRRAGSAAAARPPRARSGRRPCAPPRGSARRRRRRRPARTVVRRTKSELGSSTTIRSPVSISSRSRTTPSEYVLPDPDWPQRNVWRSKPPASSPHGTPGASASSPISSTARAAPAALGPGADLVGGRRAHHRVVERRAVALEQRALAAGVAGS